MRIQGWYANRLLLQADSKMTKCKVQSTRVQRASEGEHVEAEGPTY